MASKWALALGFCIATGGSPALALPAGSGRVTILPGWRLTPNTTFETSAALAGTPLLRPSPGGPSLTTSFAYAATPEIEVEISLYASPEQLHLQGLPALTSWSYGALVGVRFGFSLWDDRIRPSFLLATGVALALTSGAGQDGLKEKLTQAWVPGIGFAITLAPQWDLNVDYRLMLGIRGQVTDIGSVNTGGSFFSIGFSYLFEPETSHPPAPTVPGPEGPPMPLSSGSPNVGARDHV